jgi:hypothetical protein
MPIIIRLFVTETQTTVSYTYHLAHIAVFLIGAACFALDFPQRLMPGRLDFFGQGHNLFHVCIFLVVMFQFKACHDDYLTNRELIAATRDPPTYAFCFFSLLALTSYYAYVTWSFNRMIAHNFDDEGNLIDKKFAEEEEWEKEGEKSLANEMTKDEEELILGELFKAYENESGGERVELVGETENDKEKSE